MYHGTHESFQGNLIMGGQCTFTIHKLQFSMHHKQQECQDRQAKKVIALIRCLVRRNEDNIV